MRNMKWTLTAALITSLLGASLAPAHDGQGHGQSNKKSAGPHGGEVSQGGSHWLEVVFKPKGIRLYLYDSKGKAISAKGVRGSVVMQVKGNSKQYRYDLYPDAARNAETNSLTLALDLSKMPDGAMSTKFAIYGLPNSGRKPVSLARTFTMTRNAQEQAIADQKICLVSGKPLGSMGSPIKVNVKGQDVFVCCKGCVTALQENPQKYLAKLSNPPPTKSTKADAQAIAFQKKCPVMDEPLGSMGAPIKVRVKGRDVFLCCKGCVKLLKKDPAKYLAMLPSPKPAKATKADAAAIAKQKNCPVMEESLNAMGGPWKVYAKGQPLFVCCKGCIKKIQKNPDFYLAKVTK